LPSETMIWQPEFTDKTLSRKPGAVQEDRTERLVLVACLLTVIPALNLATSDTAAVAGLVMTVLTVGLVSCAGKSLPRFWPGDFFPTFYACHLAVLGVLAL
ncbi:TraX family protein, partial [Escherichia coli]|nr:TraX family protein [Escherichia coli]MCZ5067289.1 TraX family protein [Escherichia coli]MCZ5120503.1 TraX family protein [Escherichia coli]